MQIGLVRRSLPSVAAVVASHPFAVAAAAAQSLAAAASLLFAVTEACRQTAAAAEMVAAAAVVACRRPSAFDAFVAASAALEVAVAAELARGRVPAWAL